MPAEKKRDNIGHECPFRVGEWRVDPAASYIKRGGATSKLEPQVMDVLVYLASHADEVVSREKLEAVVWVNRVVGQDALTDTILKLRKAFYDDPRAPEIIETVSTRGYRMVATVQTEPAPGGLAGIILPECPDDAPNRGLYAALLAVAVLVAGLLWFILSYNNQEAIQLTESPPSTAILPLDNSTGGPAQQYFSDGNTTDLITALVVKGEGEFTARRYTEAISTLENALELEPAHQKTLLLLAASYAQTDRNEDASWAIVQLLMLHPEVSRSRLHNTFSFQDHSQLQDLLDGLEKAGLPE